MKMCLRSCLHDGLPSELESPLDAAEMAMTDPLLGLHASCWILWVEPFPVSRLVDISVMTFRSSASHKRTVPLDVPYTKWRSELGSQSSDVTEHVDTKVARVWGTPEKNPCLWVKVVWQRLCLTLLGLIQTMYKRHSLSWLLAINFKGTLPPACY